MKRARFALVPLSVVCLAAGCGGGDDAASTTTVPATTTLGPTTTAAPTTTTAAPTTTAPAPSTSSAPSSTTASTVDAIDEDAAVDDDADGDGDDAVDDVADDAVDDEADDAVDDVTDDDDPVYEDSTGEVDPMGDVGVVTELCLSLVEQALSGEEPADTVEAFYPALAECEGLDDWVSAVNRTDALGGEDPVQFAVQACGVDGPFDSVVCQQALELAPAG